MSKFQGTWKSTEADNVDAFLEATGVGSVKRKLLMSLTPKMKINIARDCFWWPRFYLKLQKAQASAKPSFNQTKLQGNPSYKKTQT